MRRFFRSSVYLLLKCILRKYNNVIIRETKIHTPPHRHRLFDRFVLSMLFSCSKTLNYLPLQSHDYQRTRCRL